MRKLFKRARQLLQAKLLQAKRIKRAIFRRRLLSCELLETRQVYSVDLGLDGLQVEKAPRTASMSTQEYVSTSINPNSATTHYYLAGDSRIGMVIDPNQVALSNRRAQTTDVASLGLSVVRPLNTDYSIYQSSVQKTGVSLFDTVKTSSLAQDVLPVFYLPATNSTAVLDDEVIVSLKPGVDSQRYFSGNSAFSGYRPLKGTSDQYVATVATGKGEAALAVANQLSTDRNLNWAAPNFYQSWKKFSIPNDPRFTNQWHLDNTGQGGGVFDADSDLPEAWDVNAGGSSQYTIGIVDDGVDLNHPDLNYWFNPEKRQAIRLTTMATVGSTTLMVGTSLRITIRAITRIRPTATGPRLLGLPQRSEITELALRELRITRRSLVYVSLKVHR